MSSQRDLSTSPVQPERLSEQKAEDLSLVFGRLKDASPEWDYDTATKQLDVFLKASQEYAAAWLTPIINKEIRQRAESFEAASPKDESDLRRRHEKRCELSKWINEELRNRGLAISYKGKLCRIGATFNAKPEAGAFEFNLVGKNTHAVRRRHLAELLPLELAPTERRKEGFVRWRDRVQGKADKSAGQAPE